MDIDPRRLVHNFDAAGHRDTLPRHEIEVLLAIKSDVFQFRTRPDLPAVRIRAPGAVPFRIDAHAPDARLFIRAFGVEILIRSVYRSGLRSVGTDRDGADIFNSEG